MEKKFTIIICAYNAENRLSKTIDSIINQNDYYKLIKNLIIVDNNSNDKTKEVILEYAKKVKNIQYLFEPKQGLGYARLAGVRNTITEWIIFIDDDNILQDNWLKNAYIYINKNKDVGALNGAVVPQIDFKMNEDESNILEIAYRGLACTHLSIEDIDMNQKVHPCGVPFGAGLVIKTSCLKKLDENGWLKTAGRTGNKMISGEDTEMCLFVKKQGFSFGYNPNMLIKHVISNNRLKEKYIIDLNKSFSEYHYMRISYENLYILRRLKNLIISSIKIIENKIKLIFYKNSIDKLKLKIEIESNKIMAKNIIKDKIFIRKFNNN